MGNFAFSYDMSGVTTKDYLSDQEADHTLNVGAFG